MRESLQILVRELERQKAAGVQSVPIDPETLVRLHRVVEARREAAVEAPRDEAPAPVARKPVEAKQEAAPTLPVPPKVALPAGSKTDRWEALRRQVLEDPVCLEHVRPGCQVVFGVGNPEAEIFFVGEAPGGEEEQQGEPFVGPAGQLLTRMINAMGLERGDVYIGNIMNWRPQLPTATGGVQYGNRPPTAEEMAYCLPYLKAQIEVVQPKVVVALGATATKGLLGAGSFKALGEVRGRWHEFDGRPLMVTYHPSYILRNSTNRSKRMIWEDLLQVMERTGLEISDRQRGYFLGR